MYCLMYTLLKAERDKLKQPEVVTVQGTATVGASNNMIHVEFDDADTAFNNASEDTPISFDGTESSEQEW